MMKGIVYIVMVKKMPEYHNSVFPVIVFYSAQRQS